MSVGERITELRKAMGMSQLDLSRELDVSRQAVSKWETDQTYPDAANLIRLSEVLDSDIEYLTTGRRNYGRRPPVVIKTTETVEKVVEKPVVQVVETVVEKIIEKPVIEYIEKPVIRKIYRRQFIRNPLEFAVCGGISFLIGLLVGILL